MTARVQEVRAHNPGPMTLDGTNTWVIDDGGGTAVVVDPGPSLSAHLAAISEAAGGRVSRVLLTHRHPDHSEAARTVAEWAGCPVSAADPTFAVDAPPLRDGEVVTVGQLTLGTVATPGHTADSVCFLLEDAHGGQLFVGDTVLGRGTTVIAEPDGNLGEYLRSLDRLVDLVSAHGVRELLPGHGPVVTDPLAVLDRYRAHRRERIEQVRQAVRAGAGTPSAVVARVYADVDRSLWPAAEQSVAATLAYLASEDDAGH